MNFLALPVFAVDPLAGISAIPVSAGSTKSDGSQTASDAFLVEMLLASEAASDAPVPVEAKFESDSGETVIPPPLPWVPLAQEPVLSIPQELLPPSEESQDSVATAYAMVAMMQVALTQPAPSKEPTPLAVSQPVTPAMIASAQVVQTAPVSEPVPLEVSDPVPPVTIARAPVNAGANAEERISDASWESLDEPEDIERSSNVSPSPERVDVSSVVVPVPVTATSVRADGVGDAVRERLEQKPASVPNAIPTEPANAPARPISEAPVILEAHITKKASTADIKVAPLSEERPALVERASHDTSRAQPVAILPSEAFQSDTEKQDEHPEGPPNEKAPSVDRALPVSSPVASSPAIKVERQISTELPSVQTPVTEDRQLSGERTPLKQIDVRIPDPDGDVTVRLQERAGSLHVSVRSADTRIATSVASGLPDLTRALDTEGFRTETWTPHVGPVPDIRVDEPVGAVTTSRIETQNFTQTEQSQAEDGRGESPSDPDWQEQQDKRRKRPFDEDLMEDQW